MYAMLDLNKFAHKLEIRHIKLSQFFMLEANYFKKYIQTHMPQGTEISVAIAKHSQLLMEVCSMFDSDTQELVENFEKFMV